MGSGNTFTLVCVYAYRGPEMRRLGEFATVAVECKDPAEFGYRVVGYPGSYEVLVQGLGQHLGRWVDPEGGVWDRYETTTVRATDGDS